MWVLQETVESGHYAPSHRFLGHHGSCVRLLCCSSGKHLVDRLSSIQSKIQLATILLRFSDNLSALHDSDSADVREGQRLILCPSQEVIPQCSLGQSRPHSALWGQFRPHAATFSGASRSHARRRSSLETPSSSSRRCQASPGSVLLPVLFPEPGRTEPGRAGPPGRGRSPWPPSSRRRLWTMS